MFRQGRQAIGIHDGGLRSFGTSSSSFGIRRGSSLGYDSSSRGYRGFPAARRTTIRTTVSRAAIISLSTKVGFPPRNSGATAAAKQLYISASTVRRHQWNSRETGSSAWALCEGQDGFNEAADDVSTSDEVGEVTLHSRQDRWRVWHEALVDFKKEHGHCNVPQHYIKKNLKLGTWVSNQRVANRNGKLDPGRKRQLDGLGFIWRFKPYNDDERWEEMFRQLEGFHMEHGHCNVSRHYKKNPKLGRWALLTWVDTQRITKAKNMLDAERVRRLDNLGFVWSSILDEKWEEMFRQLKEFQKEHGHCNVPQQYKKNPKLGVWVHYQRVANRKGKLAPERKRRLDDLVFAWTSDSCGHKWEDSCGHKWDLKDFHMEHGHCRVPRWYKKDDCISPSLGRWVNTQQTAKNKGKLAPERKRRLDELGIVWSMPRDDGNRTE